MIAINCSGGKLPFDKLPVLEVDGKTISQSTNILKYVARETGWYYVLSLTITRVLDRFSQHGVGNDQKGHGTSNSCKFSLMYI